MNVHSPCLIFSVFRDSQKLSDNIVASARVKLMLEENGIEYADIFGKYRGCEESSILMSQEHLSLAISIARDHKQETILLLDSDRTAELLYVESGEREHIGTLRAVTRDEAETRLSCSYNPVTKTYYIVE